MSQFYKGAASGRAQLLPTKDTLTALKSDVTLESAILELCDNSLDAWKRSNNRTGKARIIIEINEHGDTTELIVRDTAGGVPRDDAAMLFGLGKTAKNQVSGAIGTFGVGAKKSLVNLGLPFRIRSRDSTADTGWSYRITEDWFNDDEDWTVPVHDDREIEPGTTEIIIEDLNYNWDEETTQELRTRLGEAYNMFLSEDMQALRGTDYDLEILVNGEQVEAEGIPNWSFSPFDGLYPRRYENIKLDISEFDSPVYSHITVGLLTKKSNRAAGTDIYCQERKVASRLRNAEGGFGSGRDRLGNFNPRHQRLKVIVELETDGDGQVLPWDTQKSSIDKHNPFMRGDDNCRGVYNWLRRTVQSYFDLDADRVPQAFLEPYDAEHPAAINDGKPKVYDYSNRTQVVKQHRPDTELKEIKSITQKAQSDAQYQITREEVLDESRVDAYIMQLERESDRNRENLHVVSSPPPEVATEHPHEISAQISELAREHYHSGVYFPDAIPEWQTARYDAYMNRHGKRDLQRLSEAPDELPVTLDELNGENEDRSIQNQKPAVYTGDKLEDSSKTTEDAEIFLVLGGETEDERGSKVMETTRKELVKQLDIDTSATDEVLWEELRERLTKSLD